MSQHRFHAYFLMDVAFELVIANLRVYFGHGKCGKVIHEFRGSLQLITPSIGCTISKELPQIFCYCDISNKILLDNT